MTIYKAEQARKVLKAEQAEYIQEAIERARTANPSHEGSRNPTGRTTFYVRTTHEALTRWAELSAAGWILDTNSTCLHVAPQTPLAFTAIAPEDVFDSYLPLIAERAEQDYVKEVEAHNKEAKKLKERADFIESEFKRREEERLAQLRATLAKEYDDRDRVQYVNSQDVQLHAR